MKRKYDNDHLVDNVPMLMPDNNIELTYEDIDAAPTGRDQAGIWHRFTTRQDVRKWAFSYVVLTTEEFRYILNLFHGKATFSFSFTNDFGEKETVTAYRKYSSVAYQSKRTGLYKNLKVEIIEC